MKTVLDLLGAKSIVEVDTKKLDKTEKVYKNIKKRAVEKLQALAREHRADFNTLKQIQDRINERKGRMAAQHEEIKEAERYIAHFENAREQLEELVSEGE